jgi:hypothetical protein
MLAQLQPGALQRRNARIDHLVGHRKRHDEQDTGLSSPYARHNYF